MQVEFNEKKFPVITGWLSRIFQLFNVPPLFSKKALQPPR